MDVVDLPDDSRFDETVSRYVNAIEKDGKQLQHMLEDTRELLTNEDSVKREFGVRLITRVLQGLPHSTLNKDQASTLLYYFTRRLQDDPLMVASAIRGIYELVIHQGPLGSAELEQLLQAIFYDVRMPGLLQAERYVVYRMLAHLLLNCGEALQTMGSTFVMGCIQAMEGERDPRCLMQAFALVPMLCNRFILGELEESLFDVCACYFPVDFNPASGGQGGITRSQLAHALLGCLTASPGFGKYCVSLAVEKLNSDLVTAKSDALQLLGVGAYVFPSICFLDHAASIWKGIHNLMFVHRQESIIPDALTCLTHLARVLSDHQNVTRMNGLFQIIWKDLEHGAVPGMGQVLEAFARASGPACACALRASLPDLLVMLSKNEGLRQVVAAESARSLLSLYARDPVDGDLTSELCSLLVDQLCSLLSVEPVSEAAAAALCAASQVAGLCKDPQLQAIRLVLLRAATGADDEVARPHHGTLLATAAVRGWPLAQEVLTLLEQRLATEQHPGEGFLKMVAASGTTALFLHSMLPHLTHRLTACFWEKKVGLLNPFASCVMDVMSEAEKHGTPLCHASLLRSIVSAWMESLTSEEGRSPEFSQTLVLVEKLAQVCHPREITEIYLAAKECSLKESMPSRMVLLGSLVCHMPSKALSGESGDGRLAQAASTTCCCLTWLAGLANKLPSAQLEELLEMLRPLLQPQWNLAKADSLIGVTKGLLFRGYPFLGHYTHMLEELLTDETLGRHIALGFHEILRPAVLTREGHCAIQLMYPQRFFAETAPFLIKGYDTSTKKELKDNFVVALCCQLKYVPKVVVNNSLGKVLPIVVDALSSAEVSVVEECILPCLTDNLELMVSWLDSVLHLLLQLAKSSRNMEVRRMALECLCQLTRVEEPALVRHRPSVLRGLMSSLADHKRVVRQAAARASTAWHMVGQPVGE